MTVLSAHVGAEKLNEFGDLLVSTSPKLVVKLRQNLKLILGVLSSFDIGVNQSRRGQRQMTTPPALTHFGRTEENGERWASSGRFPPPALRSEEPRRREAKAREERRTKDGTTHDGAEPVDSLLLAQRL